MEKEDELSIDLGKVWPFGKKKEEKKQDNPDSADEQKTQEAPETNKETAHEQETKKDDEINIDFGFFKKKEHHKKAEHGHKKTEESHHVHKKSEESEEEIDLKDIGSKIKGFFGKKEEKKPEGEEELSVDTKAITSFVTKQKALILPALLIIFAIYLSFSIRMIPSELPYTDDWAKQNIYSFLRSDIGSAVNSQYPNLPEDKKNALIDEELNKAIKSNSYTLKTGQYAGQAININEQVRISSEQLKTFFQDEKGNLYMPDIDPYYWLRYAKNIVEHGYPGDIIKDGRSYDTQQLAPNGRFVEPEDTFHPYSIAFLFNIWRIFDPGITLMYALMMYPVIIAALTVLLVFLIARRIGGDVAGLFAAVMVAINPAFLTRSLFGHGDSDTWVLFFSVLASFLFLNALETKKMKWQILYASLAGITIGLYSRFWGGWWYIFDFLLAASFIYAIYLLISHRTQITQIFSNPDAKALGIVLGIFLLFSGISVSILSSPDNFLSAPISSIAFSRIKTPVEESLWPNVLTTVAELNEGDINGIINNVGGVFLFFIALFGIMLTMTKKKLESTELMFLGGALIWWFIILAFRNGIINSFSSESAQIIFLFLLAIPIGARILYAAIKSEKIDMKLAALLIIWFIVTMYASTKGIRFVMLLVPAFAIAFGVTIGVLFRHINNALPKTLNIDKTISTMAVTLLFVVPLLFFMIVPSSSMGAASRSIANQDAPMINDAWYNSLAAIRDNSNKTAIITSWWDFGHHFKALAERPVTFDGTTQGSPQAHWVGQILRTDNEKQAVGILRMLDCGGNNAFDEMKKATDNDTLKSVQALYDIFEKDRTGAKKTFTEKYGLTNDESESVLKYTHCEPPEAFFIASEDMIGKAGVWAHFGSWDFERAYIWQNLRKEDMDEAVNAMQQKFNYTKEQAEQTYYDIRSMNDAEGNSWVSPWPSYGQIDSCQTQGTTAICNTGIKVNLTNFDVYFTTKEGTTGHPLSSTYLTEQGEVKTRIYSQDVALDLSATVIPEGENYKLVLAMPQLNSSMFTRMFFMEGHGLRNFKLLTRQRSITGAEIFVYKVDWKGSEPTIKEELVKKTAVSTGDTVSFNYIGFLETGEIFDSSINNWRTNNITKETSFNTEASPFTFSTGQSQIIPGLEEQMLGMSKGEEKTIKVTPEKGYGTNPEAHPLGNKTLFFKVRIEEIK